MKDSGGEEETDRKLDFDGGGTFISHALMDKRSVIDRPAVCKYVYIFVCARVCV